MSSIQNETQMEQNILGKGMLHSNSGQLKIRRDRKIY